MTTVTTHAPTWTWSPEVLALAKKLQVEAYLDPLLEATRDLFPEARAIRVYAWRDPEINDVEAVTFEVDVPMPDPSGYVEVNNRWYRALMQICPKPLICGIVQILIPVKA